MTTAPTTPRLADDAQRGSHSVQRLVPNHGRKHLDLFSGIGGFALAARWTGWQTIGLSEIEPYACKILKRHWPDVPNFGDVRNVRNVEADLITGGFPCQPFSTSGRRKGKSDDRWLWPEMLRIIRESRPAWVLGENVANFARMALDDVLADLEGEGYTCRAFDIPACAVEAAPHRRQRIWITAHLAGGRRDQRERGGQARPLCENAERNAAATYQERQELQPLAWEDDPDTRWHKYLALCRGMDDGLPNRVDRLRGLGNSIVPQVAAVLMREMALVMGNNGDSWALGPKKPPKLEGVSEPLR